MVKMFESFLNFLFPARCVACCMRMENGVLCAACENSVPVRTSLFCGDCGARMPSLAKICHPRSPYVFGGASDYDGAVKELILALKFKGMVSAAEPLGRILARYAEPFLKTAAWTVVPVPLSKRREKERGFNQAALIAQKAAFIWKLQYAADVLRRQRHAKPQTEIKTALSRRENIKYCFEARVRDGQKNIILIDDVTTSGATMREAALALKIAGARRILALTVAKA